MNLLTLLISALVILPTPLHTENHKGTFCAKAPVVVCEADSASMCVARDFAERTLGCDFSESAAKRCVKAFRFVTDDGLELEQYVIDIQRSGVEVRASGALGFLRAVQSIRQMLPASVYGGPLRSAVNLPCCRIEDKPAFAWRGALLDCCRYFFPVEDVKRYLDIMSVYKLNRFHWHLTEDQGWRIEIKKYPRLTGIGSVRRGTQIGKDNTTCDNVPHGGFYTQEQIREVVAYAASLGIEVIPEIDLPGHMLAALAAYPEMGCTGGPYEVWTHWGVSEDVLCPAKPMTFRFLEDVLSEVCDLFPSEYVHIGGDECPRTMWETCPDCQALIASLGYRDTLGVKKEAFYQNYVNSRVQRFLASRGKKIIVWDEAMEGNLPEGAAVMVWHWGDTGKRAAEKGYKVIMCPSNYCYFDFVQSEDASEPVGMGIPLSLEQAYAFKPLDFMNDVEAARVMGPQCNLWSEYIPNFNHLCYMLLPRLCAMAEHQWSAPSVLPDYTAFLEAVRSGQYPVFDAMKLNYRRY